MSDDYKKDRLENLFKDSFEGLSDAPAENGWDLPTDNMWGRVDAELRPDKKDRRGLLWWGLGIAVLLVASLGIFWTSQSEDDQSYLESEKVYTNEKNVVEGASTDKMRQAIREENEETNELLSGGTVELTGEGFETDKEEAFKKAETTVATEVVVTDPGVSERNHRKIEQAPSAERQQPANNKNTSRGRTSTKLGKEDRTIPLSAGVQDQENIKPAAEKEVNDTSEESIFKDTLALKRKIAHAGILNALPLKTSELTYEEEVNLPSIDYNPEEVTIPTAPMMKGFYLGGEVSILESYRKIVAKGEFIIPRFFEEEEPVVSLGYGINIGYQFSKKWSFESGLNFTSSELQTRSRRQIRYTMVDEQPNDVGEFQRNYDFAFNTSNGTIDSDVAVARSEDANIAENDFIGIILSGKQYFNYLNVPVLARYHIGQGRWQLGLKAGIINRILLDATFQFESINSLRPGVRLVVGDRFYRKRNLDGVNTYQADFEIGAGLRFLMTDKLWFYAEPTFRRSINPSHEGENFKTFPTVKAIELGANWRF